MIVQLSATADATLTDLNRLDRLHAVCDGAPAEMRLADWVELADGGAHAWLDIAACREIGRTSHGDDWAADYDRMIAYAVSKGWADEGGTRVRAHIEPPAASPGTA